jgi:two-component system heavy metal sensor histidine kinase CusS
LRSPLTTLYGELTHALRRPRDAAEYRRVIEDVLDSTRRLKQLAEDLLALARIGAEPPGPDVVLAGACVQEAVRWVARAAQDRRVTITVAGPDAALRGQPRDLARMLRNLLDNALAHAPPDSRVEVTLARREDVVVIAVSDQGPGVPTADRERVFEPFYRGALERAEGDAGAGLGLAIAREIARAHGGDVVLGDAPTRGARFVVTVPCALGAEGHRTSSRTTWTSSQTSSAAAGPGQAGSMNTDVPGETSPAGTGSTVTSATPPPAQR